MGNLEQLLQQCKQEAAAVKAPTAEETLQAAFNLASGIEQGLADLKKAQVSTLEFDVKKAGDDGYVINTNIPLGDDAASRKMDILVHDNGIVHVGTSPQAAVSAESSIAYGGPNAAKNALAAVALYAGKRRPVSHKF